MPNQHSQIIITNEKISQIGQPIDTESHSLANQPKAPVVAKMAAAIPAHFCVAAVTRRASEAAMTFGTISIKCAFKDLQEIIFATRQISRYAEPFDVTCIQTIGFANCRKR